MEIRLKMSEFALDAEICARTNLPVRLAVIVVHVADEQWGEVEAILEWMSGERRISQATRQSAPCLRLCEGQTLIVARALPNFFEGGGEAGNCGPCRMGRDILPPNSLRRGTSKCSGNQPRDIDEFK